MGRAGGQELVGAGVKVRLGRRPLLTSQCFTLLHHYMDLALLPP